MRRALDKAVNTARQERLLVLRAQIALERAEMVLAIGELRQSASPRGLASGVARSVMRAARGWTGGADAAGPGATALLGMLRRGSRFAPLLAAAWPVLRVALVRRRMLRRVLLGTVLVAAAWGVWTAAPRAPHDGGPPPDG